ncbi:MAG TPA: hypothetical protein VGD17_03130 [Chitinophagaceae bacterium]
MNYINSMGITIGKLSAAFLFLLCLAVGVTGQTNSSKKVIIVRSGIEGDRISTQWKKAVESRMSADRLDSFARIRKDISSEEQEWKALIDARANKWNGFRDSLRRPFGNTYISDTIYVMTGYLGNDDGFTFEFNTVCLDITALYRAYGSAKLPVNDNRIDRIFSHEYTHVLHKEWARQNKMRLRSFRDSILWECLYEGIGMYRSLSPKWLPVHDTLPQITRETLAALYPVFAGRMQSIHSDTAFTAERKEQLNAGLSRGPVDKKWGALPVGIWLALEAKGNDNNLYQWISKGPEAVLLLAEKYLPHFEILKVGRINK